LLRLDGSLFFGAVEHVRDELHDARKNDPDRKHVLLIGSGINFIDVAGAELLVAEARLAREAGHAFYVCSLKKPVRDLLERGGFVDLFGRDRVLGSKEDAIRRIYARLDPERCRTCAARIFSECAAALPDGSARGDDEAGARSGATTIAR
jgi:SulP family sulfate permease